MMVQYQQPARCRRGRPNPELNPDFIFVPNPAGVHSDAGFAGFGLAIMCGVRVGIFAGPDAVVTDTVCALGRPDGANSVAPRGVISEGYVCEKIYAEPVRGLAYEY